MNKENCFIRYTNEDISINVYFRNGKYWVSINDIAIIFNKSRQTIKRYISEFNLDVNEHHLDVNEHHLHINAHQIDIIYLGHKTKYYDCQIVTEILKFLPSPIAEDFIKWTRNNPSNTEENEYKIITHSNNNVTIDATISPGEVTAWLTQEQIANLYQTTVANINQHITNIYDDGELNNGATIKKYLKVQFEGKRQVVRDILYYNLDVILAVGYRVRSREGIQFRNWVSGVITEYLRKTKTVLETSEATIRHNVAERILDLEARLSRLEKREEVAKPINKIIFENTMFDSKAFLVRLLKRANKSVVLIDPFVDVLSLDLLKNKNKGVSLKIITSSKIKLSLRDIELFNHDYGGLSIFYDERYHDRYLVLDDAYYHLGTSINYLGNAFSQITRIVDEDIIEVLRKRIPV